MRFQILVKMGRLTGRHITGVVDVPKEQFTAADAEMVVKVEQFLERITGHRFHINQVK